MPKSMLAILSVALLWGWAVEEEIFGMTWAGLLRIGESLNATRADLILPDDAARDSITLFCRLGRQKREGEQPATSVQGLTQGI